MSFEDIKSNPAKPMNNTKQKACHRAISRDRREEVRSRTRNSTDRCWSEPDRRDTIVIFDLVAFSGRSYVEDIKNQRS